MKPTRAIKIDLRRRYAPTCGGRRVRCHPQRWDIQSFPDNTRGRSKGSLSAKQNASVSSRLVINRSLDLHIRSGKPSIIASTPTGPPNSYLHFAYQHLSKFFDGLHLLLVLIKLLVPFLSVLGGDSIDLKQGSRVSIGNVVRAEVSGLALAEIVLGDRHNAGLCVSRGEKYAGKEAQLPLFMFCNVRQTEKT